MRNILILLTLIVVACGPDGKHIAIDGHLLNLNQGEFFVYSTDGAIDGIDTITVNGGRFEFETRCSHKGTLVILMPNGQEIPVFVQPGNAYSVSGDAQNLKQVKVKGGKDNKMMTDFRTSLLKESDDTIPNAAIRDFVEQNPTSDVSIYLIQRQLIERLQNHDEALRLLTTMQKADEENARVSMLHSQVTEMANVMVGKTLPDFSATDVNGNAVDVADLRKGTTIILTYALWDFSSNNQVRRVMALRNDKEKKWNVLAISMDPYKKQARESMQMYGTDIINVCDERMAESPLALKLGMRQTGCVLIVKDGKIVNRSLYDEPLYSYLRTL